MRPPAFDFAFEGLHTTDLFLRPSVQAELRPEGIALNDRVSGMHTFIPTESAPWAGGKVVARRPLGSLVDGSMVRTVEIGGGAVRSAMAMARRLRVARRRGTVRLLSSGGQTPALRALCAEAGVALYPLERQASPQSLVVPLATNRVIVKDATAACSGRLQDWQLRAVAQTVRHVGSVACVSSKDGALAASALSMANGAQRYLQPTGSLNRELTFLFLRTAHSMACNLDELRRIAEWARRPVTAVDEDAPDAGAQAATLLRDLHRLGLAGVETAACTLGRRGSVVADWANDRIVHVTFELVDGHPALATPAGAGDMFLAEWMFFRERGGRGRPDPIAQAAIAATHAVAETLGLSRDGYRVTAAPV